MHIICILYYGHPYAFEKDAMTGCCKVPFLLIVCDESEIGMLNDWGRVEFQLFSNSRFNFRISQSLGCSVVQYVRTSYYNKQ